MFKGFQLLIMWPDKDMIITHMPSCFKPCYSKAVCIIDCSEAFIEWSTSLIVRAQTYSNYKSHNTVKFLVAITPTGTVSSSLNVEKVMYQIDTLQQLVVCYNT